MNRIGDVSVTDIVKDFGSPVYVYDAHYIRAQYGRLTTAFADIKHRIHYAMKANSNIEVLYLLKDLGSGIDAVSPYEIDRALNIGFKPSDIVFTPSCTSVNEILYGLEVGVNVHIGSLEYFPMLGGRLKGKSIGLRLNPNIKIEGNQKIATGHSDSKFGIPVDFLDRVFEFQKLYDFKIVGLHIHAGSNIGNIEGLKRSVDTLFDSARLFNHLKYLDIGSGLKIKYKASDKEIDLYDYFTYIKERLSSFNSDLEIKIEPGKFLVGNAGYFLTSVNIVKKGYDKKFVGINSGFNHLIRPMYYDAYHEIINISNPEGELEKYDVVGQLCEEDTFAKDRLISEIRVGDVLMFKSAGAYGFSMAMDYNLRKKPIEVMVDHEKAFEI